MKRVLDSSAIALILKRLGEESIEVLEESVTASLATYELGNVIWKEYALRRLINLEEAMRRAEQIAKILEVVQLEDIKSAEDLKEVMRLAGRLDLTFYDASYLNLAKKMGIPLVTEDKELLKKARNISVEALNVDSFLKSLHRRK